MKVRITKIGVKPDAKVETATKEEYKAGELQIKSPFVDYYVEGELIGDIEIGKSVLMVRDNRNGVECCGMFETSVVTSMLPLMDGILTFRTHNSIYKVENCDPN